MTQPVDNAIPRLHAEIGTIMLATFYRTTKPYKARYVGMEGGQYLILRLPAGAGIHDHLYEGNQVVIKYVSEGRVYGFRTEITGYMYKKGLILAVLAYPEKVETHHLRGEMRVKYLAPAQLAVRGIAYNGFVMDISPGGCRVAVEVPESNDLSLNLEEGAEVRMTCQLVGVEGPHEFGCMVMNIREENGWVNLGLLFAEVNDDDVQTIDDYVREVSAFLEEWG